MFSLLLVVVVAASPSAQAALKAYRVMTRDQVEARYTETPPPGDHWEKLDASAKAGPPGSAHTTTLWVNAGTFFVEYGPTKHKSARMMGPFSTAPIDAGAPVPCGNAVCAAGQVCCNQRCGICAAPTASCSQQVCP